MFRSTNPDGTPVRPATIAARAGLSVDTLYRYATEPGNPSGKHLCLRYPRAMALTRAANNPVLLLLYVKECGYSYPVPMPRTDRSAEQLGFDSLEVMAAAVDELACDLANGRFDPEERPRGRRKLLGLGNAAFAAAAKLGERRNGA